MARLIWTDEAVSGLRNIHDYIARDRPETARRTIDSIINKVESLATYPNSGRTYPYHGQWQVKLLPYGSFRIAYLVAEGQAEERRGEEGGDVVILGVFNGLIFLPLQ